MRLNGLLNFTQGLIDQRCGVQFEAGQLPLDYQEPPSGAIP